MSFAIIFQGQNIVQKIMCNLNYSDTVIKNTIDKASEYINVNLWNYIQNNSIELKNLEGYSQAIILTHSVAVYNFWNYQRKKTPLFMAGHSLGEYSALVCSKTIKFSDALKLVIYREKIMRSVNTKNIGSMQLITGLQKNKIQKIIRHFCLEKKVNIACINLNNQIVIAGHDKEVEKVALTCKLNGAVIIIKFPYNILSHCLILKKHARKLTNLLNSIKFHTPICNVINNVDVKCEKLKKKICNALIRQLYSTVRWKESIEYMISKGTKLILEIGSNNLQKNCNKKIVNIPIISLNNLYNIVTALKIT